MTKFCTTCREPVKDHPYIGAKPTPFTRFCDMVLVKDRIRADGTGKRIMIEADEDDGIQHTNQDNVRWMPRRLFEHMKLQTATS